MDYYEHALNHQPSISSVQVVLKWLSCTHGNHSVHTCSQNSVIPVDWKIFSIREITSFDHSYAVVMSQLW